MPLFVESNRGGWRKQKGRERCVVGARASWMYRHLAARLCVWIAIRFIEYETISSSRRRPIRATQKAVDLYVGALTRRRRNAHPVAVGGTTSCRVLSYDLFAHCVANKLAVGVRIELLVPESLDVLEYRRWRPWHGRVRRERR